jgi:hypothetical protein
MCACSIRRAARIAVPPPLDAACRMITGTVRRREHRRHGRSGLDRPPPREPLGSQRITSLLLGRSEQGATGRHGGFPNSHARRWPEHQIPDLVLRVPHRPWEMCTRGRYEHGEWKPRQAGDCAHWSNADDGTGAVYAALGDSMSIDDYAGGPVEGDQPAAVQPRRAGRADRQLWRLASLRSTRPARRPTRRATSQHRPPCPRRAGL